MPLDLFAALRREGERLVAAVGAADLHATVPGLAWQARTVAVHTGAVHRWAADVVRRRLSTNETGGSAAFQPSGARYWSAAQLEGWLASGLEELLETLSAAPSDLDCFTFLPDATPLDFWVRRQAHETAIHRADLEAVGPAGAVTPFDRDFAQDGIAEIVAFATEPGFATAESAALLLDATDGPAWRIAFGGETNTVACGPAATLDRTDATVTGASSMLYRWAWNRPADVERSGDALAVDLWRTIRIL